MKSLKTIVACSVVAIVSASVASAQTAATRVSLTSADLAAARSAKIYRHALPALNANGKQLRNLETAIPHANAAAVTLGHNRYPGDLSFNGGSVIQQAESHGLFVNPSKSCPVPGCWGAPLAFLTDLGKSNFVHVTDQYVGSTANDRYTVGQTFFASFTPPTVPLTDASMAALAHAAASKGGFSGYDHIVHVFLPPGQDVCFDTTYSRCYSPDSPATFYFCAYHASADFSDIGHVIYTVEPYVNVPGCSAIPGTPNGTLVDSTNNTLSHEIIETITDPDGTAWFNTTDNGMFFEEIGDECSFVSLSAGGFDPSNVQLNGHIYAIQPEYSNQGHVCSIGLK